VMLTEKVSSPAETRVYVWGLGLAYSRVTSGGVTSVRHVYHGDGLGSVRALTDAAGLITDTAQADPWGVAGLGAGSSAQPFGYTGEQRDLETGFLHLRARAYDPGTGRFLQRDPVAGAGAVPTTLNRYAYVLNNPVNHVDPSGQIALAVPLVTGTIGAVGGAAGALAQGGDAADIAQSAITGFGVGAAVGITGGGGAVASAVVAGGSNLYGQAAVNYHRDVAGLPQEPIDVGSVAGSAAGGYLGAPVAASAGRLATTLGASEVGVAAAEATAGAFAEGATSYFGHEIGETEFVP
jgi:RHS repeat-associated protein